MMHNFLHGMLIGFGAAATVAACILLAAALAAIFGNDDNDPTNDLGFQS